MWLGMRQAVRPLLEALRDLSPIVAVIIVFQEFVLGQPIPKVEDLLLGMLFVLVGLALFVRGLEIGLFPLGESMARRG